MLSKISCYNGDPRGNLQIPKPRSEIPNPENSKPISRRNMQIRKPEPEILKPTNPNPISGYSATRNTKLSMVSPGLQDKHAH